MKILFLTNFYPPHKIGGYEMLCQDVVDGLAKRGHETVVLTSTYGVNTRVTEGLIHRVLTLESDLEYYRVKEAVNYPFENKRNIQLLRGLLSIFQPDLVFIWGMWGLSKKLAAEAEKLMGSRVVYYLANPWPIEPNLHQAYWDMPAQKKGRKILKKVLRLPFRFWLQDEWRRVPLQFQYAPCCSEALRSQLVKGGVQLADSPIIYEGIELSRYENSRHKIKNDQDGYLSLLFVGILAPHKGVHTTIEALNCLPSAVQQKVKLTILGTGHPQYEALLHNLVEKYQLEQIVNFKQPIPRSDLPDFLAQYDVLLLPSIWEEPLALIMQEGLATGLVVVGSATGGTKEIISDGQNGILFAPDDSAQLAKIIERLSNTPSLIEEVSMRGKKTAFDKFSFNRMLDEMEALLQQSAKDTGAG